MGVFQRYWVAVSILVAMVGSSLSGQVIIRDTVRLHHRPQAAMASIPTSSVTLVFTHNGAVDMSPTSSRTLTLRNRFCGDNMTVMINGSVTSVTIPARGLGVEASSAFRVRHSPNFERSYAFYLDGELIDSLHTVANCPEVCFFSGHILTVPLYTSFTLGIDDPVTPFELRHGETTQTFTLDYSSTLCGTTVWHPRCATTVRITDGAELGSLIGADGADLGDEFVGTADQLRQLRFSANGAQPEGEVGEAVVEVASRGITSRVTFEIRRTIPPVHRFVVSIHPDTVRHGATAGILVRAVDEEGEEVDLPPETSLEFYIGVGKEPYGDLAAFIHGTLMRGDQLSGVRYDQAKSGGVVYVADGENPVGLDPPTVPIGVQLQEMPDVGGLGTVTVHCRIDPPRYAQADPRWGNEHYDSAYSVRKGDTSKVGIRTLGCALSCIAMALTAFGDTVDPGELNDYKKAPTTNASARYQGSSVSWRTIERHSNQTVHFREPVNVGPTFQLSSLNELLERCHLVIAKVFNVESVKNKSEKEKKDAEQSGNHWVLVRAREANDYEIVDPGRGLRKLSQYGRIYRYLSVGKQNM